MWCLLGAIVGDCVMYVIGYHFGRPVLSDHPRFARFITPERRNSNRRKIPQARIESVFHRPISGRHPFAGLPHRRHPSRIVPAVLDVISTCYAPPAWSALFLAWRIFCGAIANWIKRAEFGLTAVVVLAAAAAIFLWRRHKRRSSVVKPNPGDAPKRNANVTALRQNSQRRPLLCALNRRMHLTNRDSAVILVV